MKLKQGAVLSAAIIWVAFLLPILVTAQNPSFAGKEFRRIWVAGTIPDGATRTPTLSELYLTSSALFYRSSLYENGLYYIDDAGMHTIAMKSWPEFSGTGGFRFIGRMADGSLLFGPAIMGNAHPCMTYNADGITDVVSPTTDQMLNLVLRQTIILG